MSEEKEGTTFPSTHSAIVFSPEGDMEAFVPNYELDDTVDKGAIQVMRCLIMLQTPQIISQVDALLEKARQ